MLSLEATLERVERLSRSGASADVRALVRLLGSEDWQTRRAAAEAISFMVETRGDQLDTNELFRELVMAVCDKTDAGRRASAIAALEGIGVRALPALSHALKEAEASAVIALAGLIGQTGGADAVALLEPLAHSHDTNIAAAATSALGRTRHPAATLILLRQLETEDEWLRFAAVGALGELGDTRAVPALEKLLAKPLMEEAAAVALEEIANVEAARALAGNLRDADGRFRPHVLAALVSLSEDERPLPAAIQEHLRTLAQRLFLEAADDATFSDLMRMAGAAPQLRRASITALGWLKDERAVPFIGEALSDPAFVKDARRALRHLAMNAHALGRLLEAEADLVPAVEIAAAMRGTQSYQAIEAAARLSVEANDTDTMEAALAVLAGGREQLRQQRAEPAEAERAAKLAESLNNLLSMAEGRALIEIAETLGVLTSALPRAMTDRIADDLMQTEGDDHLLARLAFLDNADPLRAVEEAARAQRHKSAQVRLSAIEILSWRAGAARDNASLALHLTDEAAGVRRAAMRAMRRGAPTVEALRAIRAALADEDIWVRAEAITSLGTLFGTEGEARSQLREALDAPHPLARVAAADALAEHAEAKDWRALSQMARRDPLPEVRRAAVLAFKRCPQPRTSLSVARTALKDEAWPVRRSGVRLLAACHEQSAYRLLLHVAADEQEMEAVRGAALRAVAPVDAESAVALSCHLISTRDALLTEDAYAALASLKRTHRELLEETARTCDPRAASVINFITTVMSDE
jgi:HEAT repeat protein